MAQPVSLPTFEDWIATQPGYDDSNLREHIESLARSYANTAHPLALPNLDNVRGSGLVQIYLDVERKTGNSGLVTHLQTQYSRAGDAVAAQLGHQIADARRTGDTGKERTLSSEVDHLSSQMPQPVRFKGAVASAIEFVNQHPAANSSDVSHAASAGGNQAVNPAQPSGTSNQVANPFKPITVSTGDLSTAKLTDPLRNLLGAATAGSNLTGIQSQGLQVTGSGTPATQDQFNFFQGKPNTPLTAVPKTDDNGMTGIPQVDQANKLGSMTLEGNEQLNLTGLTVAGIPNSGIMSVAQAVKIPQQLTDEEYIRLQQNLAAAGLFNGGNPDTLFSNQIRWGDRSDPNTIAAWEGLIQQSIGSNKGIADTLQNKQSAFIPMLRQAMETNQAATVAQLAGDLHLTNPDDVHAAARTAFQTALGRAPTDSELASLTAGMHGQESAAYQSKKSQIAASVNSSNLFDNTPLGQTESLGGANVGSVGESFLAAVRQHESGGNYASPSGPGHWAGGAYQIMRDTWNNFDGYARADLAPPAVQDAKARQMLSGYMHRSNDPGVWALYWYNPSAAEAYLRGDTAIAQTAPPENNGYTYGQYMDDIRRMMGSSAITAQLPGVQTSQAITQSTGLNIGPGVDPVSNRILAAGAKGATIVDAPNVNDYVTEQARKAHPTEYQAHQLGDQYFQMLSILRGQIPTGSQGNATGQP